MRSMSDSKELWELMKTHKHSEGRKIVRKLFCVQKTTDIVVDNFYELWEYFEESETRSKKDEDFKTEFSRRLHNYLASVYTMIEHMQAFKNTVNDEEISKQYSDELERRDLKEKSEIVTGLRKFFQHYEFLEIAPTTTKTVNYIEGGMDKEEYVNVDWIAMLERDVVPSRVIRFLHEEIGEDNPLEEFLADHLLEMLEFNNWFFSHVLEEKSDEISEAWDTFQQLVDHEQTTL